MDRKPEKLKMTFFVNVDLLFGISLVLPLNFTDIFAATIYFKITIIIIIIIILAQTPEIEQGLERFCKLWSS